MIEIAERFNVHPTQVTQCKTQHLERAAEAFGEPRVAVQICGATSANELRSSFGESKKDERWRWMGLTSRRDEGF